MASNSITGSSAISVFDKLYTGSSDAITASAKLTETSGNSTVEAAKQVSSGNRLSGAIQQALVQLNAGRDISAFFDSEDGNSSSNNFSNSLLNQLPGFSNSGLSDAKAASSPLKLDPNSSSIQLQASIQKLVTQLDNGSNISSEAGLGSLQEAFNSLITKSGGEPSAQNLQAFLKLVAVNVQGSTSLGSIFSTSA